MMTTAKSVERALRQVALARERDSHHPQMGVGAHLVAATVQLEAVAKLLGMTDR